MISVRKGSDRGTTNIGWLKSWHSFSFGQYYDPKNMGFRSLRVINDDIVAGGGGFDPHPHRDMEILTWILDGALQHQDNTGGGGTLRPGDLQHMTAGKGIVHSEFNASPVEPVHLLQIWLLPESKGLQPGYEQKRFDVNFGDSLKLVASHAGSDGSLKIHQDASLYVGKLNPDQEVTHTLAPGRHAWVQVGHGKLEVNGQRLETGDAVAISDEAKVSFKASEQSEILLFDLA